MGAFNRAASEYAAYFGIVAAFLALASWLATNYFGTSAKSAADKLRTAESDFRTSRSFRSVNGLINEETQTLDQVYSEVRELNRSADIPKEVRRERERYDILVRMSFIRHGDRVVLSELERANQLVEIVEMLDLVDNKLVLAARSVRDELSQVYEQRQAAHKKAADAIGAAGNIYKIQDAEWDSVKKAIEEYREIAEIRLIPEQNRLSNAIANLEGDVLTTQREELSKRSQTSRAVSRIAMALYIISAFLALYGKWLEVRYPRPKGSADAAPQPVVSQQTAKTA